MITYNRPYYVELSLKNLLENTPENVKIVVWDNASDKLTRSIVKKYANHPRIDKIIFNSINDKLFKPTNWFFEKYRNAYLLGKVDDDCLVPSGWCETLQRAHVDIGAAGILSCWHFLPEDFNEETASTKIFQYGDHQIMRNCWVGGSGYIMKKTVLDKIGFIRQGESFTTFCIRAATKGFINGWYYPFIYQEHMDDPRSEHTNIKTEADFKSLIPLTARTFNINSRDEWVRFQVDEAQKLQAFSIDPYDFIGIRAKIKRRLLNSLGKEYFPTMRNRICG